MRHTSCVACGSADDVQHHPLVSGNEEDWNLITLCPRCYDKLLRNGVSNPSQRTRNARARGVRRPRLPAKSVMMPNWQATLLSLAVAVACYAFVVRWRAEIILISTVALAWYGFAWLCQRHPMAAVFLVGFLRGLLGSRR